jgi:FlaA1/EpsC-like NDP-sugar epimerase
MLRNIGQLLALVVASQIAILLIMVVTGLSYRLAWPIIFTVFAVISVTWVVFRRYRTRTKTSEIMDGVRKLKTEQAIMIPKFREAAQRLRDPKNKEEVLEQLAYLEVNLTSIQPTEPTVYSIDSKIERGNL